MLVCLLAGCATQPTALAPSPSAAGNAQASMSPAPTIPPGSTLRIGVEFLPPDPAFGSSEAVPTEPRVEFLPVRGPAAAAAEPAKTSERRSGLTSHRSRRHTWTLSESDLAAIDDPVERETLHFLDDLVREDRRHVRREVRLPFFEWQPTNVESGPRLWSEEATAAAQEEWINEHGPSLLQRPLRRLLRRLPLARDLEIEIDTFQSENVPLSQPYREAHRDERRFGRLSLRVHADDFADPVEIVYMKSGVRIGTSQETGKLSIDWRLTERVMLELRTRTSYDTHDHGLRADLSYWPSATTSVHVAVGDDLDFLSAASIYSLFETQMDGSPGLLMYAVHVF